MPGSTRQIRSWTRRLEGSRQGIGKMLRCLLDREGGLRRRSSPAADFVMTRLMGDRGKEAPTEDVSNTAIGCEAVLT